MNSRSGRFAITIDGPAASGKSTVALALARRLGLLLVDSGSMYRTVTLVALERGASGDPDSLAAIASEVASSFRLELREGENLRVFLGDREVTLEIRSPEVGAEVSPVSEVAAVREEMVALQRAMVEGADAVVEGRDIGTTVLPDAPLKVFLVASQEERARRRHEELQEKGLDIECEKVANELRNRDAIDSSRSLSPLAAAPDAMLIDTTSRSVTEVVDEIVGLAADRKLIR